MRPAPTSAVLAHLAVVGIVAVILLLPGSPAAADCVADERPLEQQIAEAQVAFVGTAAEVTNRDRTAAFEVHEVWQHTPGAPPLDAEVVVHGGPDDPQSASSVDRTWEPGRRYLVVPRGDDGRLVDDICTPTRPWTEDVADARPADARAVDEDGRYDDLYDLATSLPAPWIAVGVTILVGAVVGAYAASRRR